MIINAFVASDAFSLMRRIGSAKRATSLRAGRLLWKSSRVVLSPVHLDFFGDRAIIILRFAGQAMVMAVDGFCLSVIMNTAIHAAPLRIATVIPIFEAPSQAGAFVLDVGSACISSKNSAVSAEEPGLVKKQCP